MIISLPGGIEPDINIIMCAVKAIEKAVTEDVPQEMKRRHLETNNYIGHIRGDFINQNLRDLIGDVGGELIPFKRYGWKGRLLLDPGSKMTYNISSLSNLQQIPLKRRNHPHFLQTLLRIENGDLKGTYQQMSMYDVEQFDQEVYSDDFVNIACGAIVPLEGYHHCVVAYQAERGEVTDIRLILFDPSFNIVEECDLNDLRKANFYQLTEDFPNESTTVQEHNRATRGLTKLKEGIKPRLWNEEKRG